MGIAANLSVLFNCIYYYNLYLPQVTVTFKLAPESDEEESMYCKPVEEIHWVGPSIVILKLCCKYIGSYYK